MKMIIILGLIFILCSTINSQDILWKKNFGLNSADDFGQSVIETNDGNIAIAGYTGSYGAGGFDVWLIKTDADGNIIWTKTYGGTGDDYAYSMKQTDDGGFIIGGATNSFGSGGLDYYLIKTDSLGDKLWTKTFGGVNDDICWSLELVEDGYVLAGGKNMQPSNPDFWIIKVDLNGNIIWEKTFGTTGAEVLWSISKTLDNGLAVAGYYPSHFYDGWLIKLNSDGDSLWSRKYTSSGSGSDYFKSVKETSDKGFILTGKYYNDYLGDLWLLKTDSLGNVEWEKTYDYDNDYDIGYSVQQTSDGGFIVVGAANPFDIEDMGWIIRTNSVGDTLWTKFIWSYTKSDYGFSASTDCYSVIQAQNGDYVVAGAQTQISFQKEVLLLRIASDIVPVELTSFTATTQQNKVSLNWQTATETNNSGFEIERTSPLPSPYEGEGATLGWSVVGFVPGFGTTTEPKSYSFIDENVSAGNYQYRLKQIDFDGSFEYSNTVEVEITSPTEFSLEQNYPNPFNPSTTISLSIPERSFVTLKIYDILGRELAALINEELETGSFEKTFDASNLASGVYIYRISAMKDGKILFNESKQMLMIK